MDVRTLSPHPQPLTLDPDLRRFADLEAAQRVDDVERVDGLPGRIPHWIAETHERAASARAELLRRIARRLDGSRARGRR